MGFQRILVSTDFGEPSLRAADLAVEMAIKYEAALVLAHVCEPPSYSYPGMAIVLVDLLTDLEVGAKQQLDKELARVRASLPRATAVLQTGKVWETVLAMVESSGADLVVLGTHGRSGVAHLLLGSVAEKIVRTSRVPVLTVRPPASSALATTKSHG